MRERDVELHHLSPLNGRCRCPACLAEPADRQIGRVLDALAQVRHRREMGIEILTENEIVKMRKAGRVAAETLAFIGTKLRPGVSTAEIDRWVREDTAKRGGKPSQLGYKGFPAAVCTSRNAVVCHGIPSTKDILQPGDIVNVDVTTLLDGFHGDTSRTFVIGEASPDAVRLVDVARRCRDAGIAVIRDGARLGDIGAAIEELARKEGVSVVTELGGHGIGRKMHADPHVSHTGTRGTGVRLKTGMALTVEPMINLGRAGVEFLDDGWTVVTADGSLSAQWEHTVIVRPDGYELTTLLDDGMAPSG
jgi:methionyl aminopeptidase